MSPKKKKEMNTSRFILTLNDRNLKRRKEINCQLYLNNLQEYDLVDSIIYSLMIEHLFRYFLKITFLFFFFQVRKNLFKNSRCLKRINIIEGFMLLLKKSNDIQITSFHHYLVDILLE